MRTAELKELYSKLSELNRNFTHFLFISEQFFLDNEALITSRAEEFTPAVFTGNKYAPKFNYRMHKVPEVFSIYKDFTLVSFYVFAYSLFSLYVEQLMLLTERVVRKNCQAVEGKTTLERMFQCLESAVADNLEEAEIKAIDYIRLRRNSVLHEEGDPSPTLKKIIKHNGPHLNTFFRTTPGLRGADFTKLDIIKFSESELIGFINLLRRLSKKIDHRVLTLLGRERVLDYLFLEFKAEYALEIKRRTEERLRGKFLMLAKIKFNIREEEVDLSRFNFKGE